MKRLLFLVFLYGLFALSSIAQPEEPNFDTGALEKVKPSIVEWTWNDGIYQSKEGPHTVYLLMNVGGLGLPPISKNFKDLIKSWLKEHPDAEAVVTNTIPGKSELLGWTLKPVWVRYKDEILNVYLVRMGACSAKTMLLSAALETPLSPDQVRGVHRKIWEAEEQARKEKLGIWIDSDR